VTLPTDPDAKKVEERSFWLAVARYSQIAVTLPAAVVAGWLLGAFLDRRLHTTWLNLAGLIVGIVAGFVELIRTVLKAEPGEEGK
jgi:F0F1-type ATP synthase assembly protein I